MGILEERKRLFSGARASAARSGNASRPAKRQQNQSPQPELDAPDIPGAQFDDPLRLVALEADIAGIKSLNNRAARTTAKRDNKIPTYMGYLNEHMAANEPASAVLVQVMIWQFDVENFEEGLKLARYAVAHKGHMPLNFKRDIPNFVLGQVADWALVQTSNGSTPDPYLGIAEQWRDNKAYTIIDLINALLLKARAEEFERLEQPEKALVHYEQAQEAHEKARCKMQIKRLIKQLAQPEKEAANAQK